MVKKVIIAFADPRINPKEHAKDLKNAIEHACFNLRYRCNIVIQGFIMDDDGFMHLKIFVPDGVKFNAGNRLRGISNYLLSQCEFPYKEYRVGKRLLHYFPSKQKADFRMGKYNNPEYWKNIANRKKERDTTTIDAEPELDKWCTDCKEYDQERHCCPRYNRVIRETVEPHYCRECKWSRCHINVDKHGKTETYWHCLNWDGGTDEEGFCHEWERRTDSDE